MPEPTAADSIFHQDLSIAVYADVLLPLALDDLYTYQVPEALIETTEFGKRVEVPFGKRKSFAGIVVHVHRQQPDYRTKRVLAVLDREPIIDRRQWHFWQWMANYYGCTPGEVMEAAVPANLKMTSERRLVLGEFNEETDFAGLIDSEYVVMEALVQQGEISISDARIILQDYASIYPILKRLLDKRFLIFKEESKERYAPKRVGFVRLQPEYAKFPHLLADAFNMVERSERQTRALLAYTQLSKNAPNVRQSELNRMAGSDLSVLRAIEKKGIFELFSDEVSRLNRYGREVQDKPPLTEQQTRALTEIRQYWTEKNVCLLHGVTGSGKTRIYIELIEETLAAGKQVLYLLPEVSLTTQIIGRLQRIFGDEVRYYHHRLNNNERVETWLGARTGGLLVGARSAVFQPFANLGLVIVDEEHDASFKQQDPAPRYHGRDAAIFLAHIFKAKVLLGTATPALETYFNAKHDKYGLVEMQERYGGVQMPELQIVDLRAAQKAKEMHGRFSKTLLDEIKTALTNEKQVILFQNRRGFAPRIVCTSCGWHQECRNCDVGMTYHKFTETCRCHYCGSRQEVPKTCPACSSDALNFKGFGTQQLEEEIQLLLPDARVGRMDFDTVKGKNAYARLIEDFEDRQLDILVGTQMVSKGLDFDNVALVGILSADQMLAFPDFRASERAYQLMTQVAGRAGRRAERGRVLIQTYDTAHPVLQEITANDYPRFFTRETTERHEFHYPPYVRLMRITLKHVKAGTVNEATKLFAHELFKAPEMKQRTEGPAQPPIGRVRNQYLMDFLVKLSRHPKHVVWAKEQVQRARLRLKEAGLGSVRVQVDVDPV